MIDICNHIVAREGWGLLKTYQDGIRILTDHQVLDRDMIDTYLKMVRFRNRIVHLYDEVNSEEVFLIIHNNLRDFEKFITAIVTRYFI